MWELREYQPSELSLVADMTREFYGDIEISREEYLRWQYEENPAGRAIITLAQGGERREIAGQYVIIPAKFHVSNKWVIGTLSLNTLTKDAYRGQGVFTGLAEAAFQFCEKNKLAFTFGFPNPNSFPGFTGKLRFCTLGVMPLLLRPIDLTSLIRKKVGGVSAVVLKPFGHLFCIGEKNDTEITVSEITREKLEEIDSFWDEVKNKYPVMGIRDAAFIRWRYFDIPFRQYKLYGAKKNGKFVGYIIGRCTEVSGMRSGMIVDLIYGDNCHQVGEVLVDKILRYFAEENMELAGCLMGRHTQEYRVLIKKRFIPCPKFLEPQPFPVIFRSHQHFEGNEIMCHLGNWFLTMGDYDAI